MFRKLTLLAAGFLAVAGGASAADLYAPPQASFAPASYAPQGSGSWNGFYAGGNFGAAFGKAEGKSASTSITTGLPAPAEAAEVPLLSTSKNKTSAIGGVQFGYNFQVDGFLFGAEADLNYLGRKSSVGLTAVYEAEPIIGNYNWSGTASTRNDWLSTFRLRAGYLATPQFLIYATGGLAVGDVRSTVVGGYSSSTLPIASDYIAGQRNETRVGYSVGAGAEYELTPSVTLRGEYLYSNLGRQRVAFFGPNSVGSVSNRNDVHMLRAGLNYRFGSW